MISTILGPQTISQSLARSKFVDTRNTTAQSSTITILDTIPGTAHDTAMLPGESLVTPVNASAEDETTVQSDGSLEKFVMDERVHLISIIRVWMQKNVTKLFEKVIFSLYGLVTHCILFINCLPRPYFTHKFVVSS